MWSEKSTDRMHMDVAVLIVTRWRRSLRLLPLQELVRRVSQHRFACPTPTEARQALLAGEQFLHGALFEVALLGDELLQGFDEGIRIAQRLGDGFLFGFGGGRELMNPDCESGIACSVEPIAMRLLNLRRD